MATAHEAPVTAQLALRPRKPDIENVFLDRVAHGRGAAVRIERCGAAWRAYSEIAASSVALRGGGPSGEAADSLIVRRCAALDPVGDATARCAAAGEFRE